jgi:hypothetical protein
MSDAEATDNAEPVPLALPEGRLVGRVAFTDAVRQAIGAAASQGWPMLWLVDDDFADWPLGERSVIAGLNAWARRGRQMRLLARDFSAMRALHPRFAAWRTTWAHIVEAHAVAQASPHELPGVIWTASWTLERLDPVRSSLVASHAPERRVALHERLDEWWIKGRPAFAPTTLGL